MESILKNHIPEFKISFMIINEYLAKYHDLDNINQQIMTHIRRNKNYGNINRELFISRMVVSIRPGVVG